MEISIYDDVVLVCVRNLKKNKNKKNFSLDFSCEFSFYLSEYNIYQIFDTTIFTRDIFWNISNFSLSSLFLFFYRNTDLTE